MNGTAAPANGSIAVPFKSEDNHALSNLKRMMQHHHHFRRLLADEKELSLPYIAAVGTQSAGKSTMLSAISGVKFPSGGNICTRCPIEVRISVEEAPYQCEIKVQRNGTEERVGELILDKTLLPERLAAAHDKLTGESDSKLSSAPRGLTEQRLILEINDKTAYPLSVVDLPGIYAVGAGSEQSEKIAESTLARPNCIILLTLKASEEPNGPISARLARNADELGVRTIGVITHPDHVNKKDPEAWRQAIQNRSSPGYLAKGYYTLKNGDEPPDPTEDKVLSELLPNRWGPSALQAALSAELIRVFTKDLPRLSRMLKESLDECREELKKRKIIAPAEARQHLNGHIEHFSDTVKRCIDAQGAGRGGMTRGDAEFYSKIREGPFRAFVIAIRLSKPLFLRSVEEAGDCAQFNDTLRDDFDKYRVATCELPRVATISPDKIAYSTLVRKVESLQDPDAPHNEITMSEISVAINDTTSTHLSKDHPEVARTFVEEITNQWQYLTEACLDDVEKAIKILVERTITDMDLPQQFDSYLSRAARDICEDYKRDTHLIAKNVVDSLRSMNPFQPDRIEELANSLSSQLDVSNPSAEPSDVGTKSSSGLPAAELFNVAVRVLGHWKLASETLNDIVPKLAYNHFAGKFGDNLKHNLTKKLERDIGQIGGGHGFGKNEENWCYEKLAPSPEDKSRNDALLLREERLQEAAALADSITI
ncbi:hypothetical protein CF327_g5130 [Tilletia walkeri]|nr:hypothetical protein CF327_g5130 [Tilletia walkeri]